MKPSLIIDTLSTMTRGELRNVARRLNVPTGRNKIDSIINISSAIRNKTARFTIDFTIRDNPIPTATYANVIFRKKIRTHKADKVILQARQLISMGVPLPG